MPLSLTLSCRFTGSNGGAPTYDIIVRVPKCLPGVGVVRNVDMTQFMSGVDYTGFVNEYGNHTPLTPSTQRLRRSATRQELATGEALGGSRQTGSGSRIGNKGDARVIGRYRIESKFRTAESVTVKLADLRKIRAECQGTEVPIFEIEFREKQTLRAKEKWALVPWSEWEKLANASRDDR